MSGGPAVDIQEVDCFGHYRLMLSPDQPATSASIGFTTYHQRLDGVLSTALIADPSVHFP